MANSASASVICGDVGMCSSSSKASIQEQSFAARRLLAPFETYPKQTQKKNPGRLHDLEEGALCEFCETAVSYVEQSLKDNQTQAEIIYGLEYLCNSLDFGGIGGQATVDCDKLDEMPDVTFTIGGRDLFFMVDSYGASPIQSHVLWSNTIS
eukprot:TRINITY_DN44132_c0_g1_i1.p2 TRINITY_DN44132_c0_g1~~TRINITY_DN44132_c0_g1_i1.p2  ORF type:complete len:165 (-),score=14.65 TRINITY_DN44132_c0_g1_i1:6-461(-)